MLWHQVGIMDKDFQNKDILIWQSMCPSLCYSITCKLLLLFIGSKYHLWSLFTFLLAICWHYCGHKIKIKWLDTLTEFGAVYKTKHKVMHKPYWLLDVLAFVDWKITLLPAYHPKIRAKHFCNRKPAPIYNQCILRYFPLKYLNYESSFFMDI